MFFNFSRCSACQEIPAVKGFDYTASSGMPLDSDAAPCSSSGQWTMTEVNNNDHRLLLALAGTNRGTDTELPAHNAALPSSVHIFRIGVHMILQCLRHVMTYQGSMCAPMKCKMSM